MGIFVARLTRLDESHQLHAQSNSPRLEKSLNFNHSSSLSAAALQCWINVSWYDESGLTLTRQAKPNDEDGSKARKRILSFQGQIRYIESNF